MKLLLSMLLTGAILFQVNAQNNQTNMDTLSYSVGVMLAQGLKSQNLTDLNADDLAKAINDVLKGNEQAVSTPEAEAIFREYLQKQQMAQHEGNIAAGKAFLAENAKRPEVKTTASGLQYEVLTEGAGAKPKATDQVTVHYHGTLIDGTVFDSSVERGQPATFGLNQVISGWTEGLQLMPTGAKYRFYLPYDLAYGERGAGPKIGPYTTLIFDVELLKVN